MAYCPNPDCKHKQRTGKPAEFQAGISTCKDCGTRLVDENPEPPQERPPCPPPLRRRIWFTIAVICALWLAMLIPPPLVNLDLLQDLTRFSFANIGFTFGPLSRGPNPFLAAFVLVEIIALAIPAFRRRRHNDANFRSRLWTVSVVGGLALCMLGAFYTAIYMESLGGIIGNYIVENPGWGFRIAFVLITTAGSCLYIAAVHLINRFGVGSGFAVVILASGLAAVPNSISGTINELGTGALVPLDVVLGIVALGVLATGVWLFLHLGDRKPSTLPLRLPTCGLFPVELAYIFLILPSTLNNFFGWYYSDSWLQQLAYQLTPSNKLYLAMELILIAIFVPLASSLFYWRRRKEFKLDANRAAWRRARYHSAAFLVGVAGAWFLAYWFLYGAYWLLPSSLTLIVACAIIADLRKEIRARWNAPAGVDLVVLESHQDVADAVEAGGKGLVIQGLLYRSLTYFFGPFVPLNILGTRSGRA